MSNISKRGIYVLPNLFTSANLFFGFLAIIHALKITLSGKTNYQWCVYYILFAAIFDMADGRVARKYNSASRFGIEYDSLCDLVSFGVAPALVTYLWMFQNIGRLGWVICFLYVACAALRLGRFNVQAVSVESKHFQGLPVPMAALLICGILQFWKGVDVSSVFVPVFGNIKTQVLVTMFLLALTMVSEIPYRNTKSLSLRQRVPFSYLLVGIMMIVIFAMKPKWIVFGLGMLYFLSGPVEWLIRAIIRKPMQEGISMNKIKKSETNKDVRLVHPKNPS